MNRFQISPGEEALKAAFQDNKSLEGPYQQFSSYPSAFVVASDIELSVSPPQPQLRSTSMRIRSIILTVT